MPLLFLICGGEDNPLVDSYEQTRDHASQLFVAEKNQDRGSYGLKLSSPKHRNLNLDVKYFLWRIASNI